MPRVDFHGNGDFIPKEGKVAGIIEYGFLEYETIGNTDDFTIGRILPAPIPDLHRGSPQKTDVNNVALDAFRHDPVPNLIEIRKILQFFCSTKVKLTKFKQLLRDEE